MDIIPIISILVLFSEVITKKYEKNINETLKKKNIKLYEKVFFIFLALKFFSSTADGFFFPLFMGIGQIQSVGTPPANHLTTPIIYRYRNFSALAYNYGFPATVNLQNLVVQKVQIIANTKKYRKIFDDL